MEHGQTAPARETILRLAASKEAVVTMCENKAWDDAEVQSRLERIRDSFGLECFRAKAAPGEAAVDSVVLGAGSYALMGVILRVPELAGLVRAVRSRIGREVRVRGGRSAR